LIGLNLSFERYDKDIKTCVKREIFKFSQSTNKLRKDCISYF
jgi:hypothetical protein